MCSYCHVGASAVTPQATDLTCFGCWACCLYPEAFKPLDDICPSWCAAPQILTRVRCDVLTARSKVVVVCCEATRK